MSPFAWSHRSHAQKVLLSDNISEWSGNRREAAEQYCKNRVLEAVDGTASLPSGYFYKCTTFSLHGNLRNGQPARYDHRPLRGSH